MPPGKVLPDKYYKLVGAKDEFKWVSKVTATDLVAGGKGGSGPMDRRCMIGFPFIGPT